MKSAIYLSCLGAGAFIAMHQAVGQPVPLPAEVDSCVESAWVTEPYSLQASEGCPQILTGYMQGHWRDVLNQWDTIATTDKRKWVLLNTCEALDADNYMKFLEEVRDLRRQNKISTQMFEVAALMPGYRKEAFLALNHENSSVQQYIASIRQLTPSKLQGFLDEILSGLRKGAWEERYQKAKIPIEPLLLPNTSAARTRSLEEQAKTGKPPLTTADASEPTAVTPQASSAVAQQRSLLWAWILGILALIAIVAFALKRRA